MPCPTVPSDPPPLLPPLPCPASTLSLHLPPFPPLPPLFPSVCPVLNVETCRTVAALSLPTHPPPLCLPCTAVNITSLAVLNVETGRTVAALSLPTPLVNASAGDNVAVWPLSNGMDSALFVSSINHALQPQLSVYVLDYAAGMGLVVVGELAWPG